MILRCENCQTMYMFTEAQLKSQNYKFTCKKCGHENTVAVPSDTEVKEKDKQQKQSSEVSEASQTFVQDEQIPEEIKNIIDQPLNAEPEDKAKESQAKEPQAKEPGLDDIFSSLNLSEPTKPQSELPNKEETITEMDFSKLADTGVEPAEHEKDRGDSRDLTKEEGVIEGFEEFTMDDIKSSEGEDTGQTQRPAETEQTTQEDMSWLESTKHEDVHPDQTTEDQKMVFSNDETLPLQEETAPEILTTEESPETKVTEAPQEETSLLEENDIAIPDASAIMQETIAKEKPVERKRHLPAFFWAIVAGIFVILIASFGGYYYLVEYTPSHPDFKKLTYMSYSILPVSAKDRSRARQLLAEANRQYLKDTIIGYENSLNLYERAVGIDHHLIEAYAGIAKDYAILKDRNSLQQQLKNSNDFLSRLKLLLKDNAQYNLVKAMVSIANNDYRDASDNINTALRKSPDLPEALYYKGYIDFKQGQPLTTVTPVLEKAISLEPDMIKAKLLLASVFYKQGDLYNATKLVDDIIISVPDNVSAIILKADIEASSTTGTTSAIAALKDTLNKIGNKIDKYDRARLYYTIGQLYLVNNDYGSAIKALNTSLEDDRSASTYILLGDVYLKSGNISEAEKQYRQALAIDNTSAQANLKLAQACYMDHKYVMAISYFNESLKLKNNNDPQAFYGLALAREKNGELDAALNAIENAVRLLPDDPAFITLNGKLLRKKKDYAKALEVLAKGVDKFPSYAPLHTEYAIVLTDQGNYPEAIKQLNTAISMSPSSAENYAYMAHVLNKEGKYSDAKNYALKALEINNTLPFAYEVLGDVYFNDHNLNGAIKAYNSSIALQPYNDEVLDKLANVYTAGKMFTNAVSYLDSAIKINPTNANYHYQLGNIYKSINNIQLAINEYTKAIDLNPSFADAYYQRGLMNIEGKNDLAAINDLKSAMKYAPDNPDYMLALANYYYNNKETFAAIDYLNMALKVAPKNPEIHYRLGVAYNYIGRIDDAKKEFLTALTISPDYSNAMVGLGNIYYQEGSMDKAQQYYEKAIKFSPENGDAYYALGTVYEYNGMYEKALSAYKMAVKFSKNPATAYFKEGMMFANLNETKQAREILLKAINLGLPGDMEAAAKNKLRNLM